LNIFRTSVNSAVSVDFSESATPSFVRYEVAVIRRKGPLRRLFGWMKESSKYATAALGASVALGLISPGYGLLFGLSLEAYYDPNYGKMRKQLSCITGIFGLLGVSAFFMHCLQDYTLRVTGERLVKRLREKVLRSKQVTLPNSPSSSCGTVNSSEVGCKLKHTNKGTVFITN
jgi:hypothetical protein